MKLQLPLATLLLSTSLALAQTAPSPPATSPTTTQAATSPAFTLGQDTTRITAPLLADGRPDYVTYLDQTLSKGVTPENNAVVALLEVLGTDNKSNILPSTIHDEVLKRLGIRQDQTSSFQGFADYLKKQKIEYDTPKQNEESLALKHPWNADGHPDIARWLDENDQALDRIAKAIARERYYWPMIAISDRAAMGKVLLPGLGRMKEAANGLTTRAMLRLGKGQNKEAQADLIAVHRLGRLVSHGPTFIGQLVGVAIETLAARGDVELAAELRPDVAKAYLAELAKLPPLGDGADAVDIGERFMMLDGILTVSKYGIGAFDELDALAGEGPSAAASASPPDPRDSANVNWDKVLKNVNGGYDRLVAAMRLPTHAQRRAALAALDKDMERFKVAGLSATNPTDHTVDRLIAILFPSLGRARELADRAQERTDLATLALALSAFHGDKGSYPDKLQDLAPAYLKEVPQDIFAGAPLKYRREGPGYLLYSIGPDLKDDNGVPGKNDNTGDFAVKMLK